MLPYDLVVNILAYLSWLFREIANANVAVGAAALSDLSEVRPRMVEIESSQTSEVGRVIFANSITLTPGTVTVDIADQRMLIHALTESASDPDALKDMDRRVTRLEG